MPSIRPDCGLDNRSGWVKDNGPITGSHMRGSCEHLGVRLRVIASRRQT
jgi:hypothetical protein